MVAQDLGQVFMKMRTKKITQIELARHMGLSKTYVNEVFTGKRNPKGAEERFNAALNELIAEKEETA